jgi:hypothetical protein
LPEKFKSLEALNTSYAELERLQNQRREQYRADIKAELEAEQAKDVPAAPADYTFTPIKMRNNQGKEVELQLQADDPLTQWFQNTAHALKIGQKDYERLIGEFIQQDLKRGPNWQQESAALGAQADLRLQRIDGWARGHLTQEHYGTFASVPATAAMIKLFEHVMTLTGEPTFVPDPTGGSYQQNLTRADLNAMMTDKRYRDGDKQFIAQVRAGFRRLTNGGA